MNRIIWHKQLLRNRTNTHTSHCTHVIHVRETPREQCAQTQWDQIAIINQILLVHSVPTTLIYYIPSHNPDIRHHTHLLAQHTSQHIQRTRGAAYCKFWLIVRLITIGIYIPHTFDALAISARDQYTLFFFTYSCERRDLTEENSVYTYNARDYRRACGNSWVGSRASSTFMSLTRRDIWNTHWKKS